MDTPVRQDHMAGARDVALQKLHDVTIAIAIAATAAVGLTAWVSAATIPGTPGTASLTGNAATVPNSQPVTSGDDGFTQAPPSTRQFGPAAAVTGGSR
jgi:hypothetical protein